LLADLSPPGRGADEAARLKGAARILRTLAGIAEKAA